MDEKMTASDEMLFAMIRNALCGVEYNLDFNVDWYKMVPVTNVGYPTST